MYARLNHVGICLSYTGSLKIVQNISDNMKPPIEKWLKNCISIKFVGDNVDKRRGVRDIRIDSLYICIPY